MLIACVLLGACGRGATGTAVAVQPAHPALRPARVKIGVVVTTGTDSRDDLLHGVEDALRGLPRFSVERVDVPATASADEYCELVERHRLGLVILGTPEASAPASNDCFPHVPTISITSRGGDVDLGQDEGRVVPAAFAALGATFARVAVLSSPTSDWKEVARRTASMMDGQPYYVGHYSQVDLDHSGGTFAALDAWSPDAIIVSQEEHIAFFLICAIMRHGSAAAIVVGPWLDEELHLKIPQLLVVKVVCPRDPEVARFAERFRKRHGRWPTLGAMRGFDAGSVVRSSGTDLADVTLPLLTGALVHGRNLGVCVEVRSGKELQETRRLVVEQGWTE